MIGKTGSGSGFGGLTRYLLTGRKEELNPDRVLWTSTRELALDDPRQAAQVMRATASQGQTDKPVQHLSISLAPGEHLSREQWEQVVDTTLRDLGLKGHQALVVAHNDTPHEHIHIVVNRVHPETLKAWDRWQDRPRMMESLRAQELALGLRATPYAKNLDQVPSPLLQQFERTGEPPLLDYARAAARPAFREAASWNELHERLAEQGLYMERKGQGLIVTDDHRQVKASSVDRAASLRALEIRLGAYEPRRPVLQEVNQELRDEQRVNALSAALAPLQRARQERSMTAAFRPEAVHRLESARASVLNVAQSAYRDPAEAARRFFVLAEAGRLAEIRPSDLGQLKGLGVGAGGFYLPLGAQGEQAYRAASETLPQAGVSYLQARDHLQRMDSRLEGLERHLEALEREHRPQVAELERLHGRPALDLPEQVLSMRPRDQLAFAREHGPQTLERAAKISPQVAERPAIAREEWMGNLAPQLDRALDRQLARHNVPLPSRQQAPAEWMANALRQGLRPAHAAQALLRAGVPLAETLRAASRTLTITQTLLRTPAKAAVRLTAQALGIPTLPLRLASIALSLVREIGRGLTR